MRVELALPESTFARLSAHVAPEEGEALTDVLVRMIEYGITLEVIHLPTQEDEMAKRQPERFRVAADGEREDRVRKWSVVDDAQGGRKVHPGTSLGRAHLVAEKLNRERDED